VSQIIGLRTQLKPGVEEAYDLATRRCGQSW